MQLCYLHAVDVSLEWFYVAHATDDGNINQQNKDNCYAIDLYWYAIGVEFR